MLLLWGAAWFCSILMLHPWASTSSSEFSTTQQEMQLQTHTLQHGPLLQALQAWVGGKTCFFQNRLIPSFPQGCSHGNTYLLPPYLFLDGTSPREHSQDQPLSWKDQRPEWAKGGQIGQPASKHPSWQERGAGWSQGAHRPPCKASRPCPPTISNAEGLFL